MNQRILEPMITIKEWLFKWVDFPLLIERSLSLIKMIMLWLRQFNLEN